MAAPYYGPKRLITYEELKQHSSYSDAWLSINGTVYDITHFISKHPFGDTFRGHLGTESGGLFSSAHVNTNVEALMKKDNFLKINSIQVVGHLDISRNHLHQDNVSAMKFLDRIVYKDTNKDMFWQELKNSVASYLKENGETTHYTNLIGIIFLVYYISIYLCLSYLSWVNCSFLATLLLGVHVVCMQANISHMATHSGFTRSPWLDFIAMHLFDCTGMSGLEWQITHQTHHYQPHSSIDHQTSSYFYIGVRIHKYMKHRVYHHFQYVYFWISVSFYLLLKLVITTAWLFVYRKFLRHKYDVVAHFIGRIVLFSQILYSAYVNGIWMALAIFAMYIIVASVTSFLLLFNDHEENHKFLGEIKDARKFHGKISWAEAQVRTSGNWYPTNWLLQFIQFHYGYFNFHIEHHLFPTLKPALFMKISPIVKRVCIKHGIPYTSTTFFDMQKSLQKHISKLSTCTHTTEG